MLAVAELDEDWSKGKPNDAEEGARQPPGAARNAGHYLRFALPRIEPSTPRRTWRPSSEPLARAALLAAPSPMPLVWWPPRGPVRPNSTSERMLPMPPEAGAC